MHVLNLYRVKKPTLMGRVKAPRVVEKRATKRERGHKLRHNEITATVLIKGGRRKKLRAEQVIHALSIVAGLGLISTNTAIHQTEQK